MSIQTTKRTTMTIDGTRLEDFITLLTSIQASEGIPNNATIVEADAEVEMEHSFARSSTVNYSMVTLVLEWPA